jgi:predicted PurR-regulated permease PerM
VASRGPVAARAFLLVLLAIVFALVAMIARPFAKAIFMGGVLAVAFHPWYKWLLLRLRGRRTVAASLITVLLVLAIVLPVSLMAVTAIRETVQGLDTVHDILAREGVDGLIQRTPDPIRARVQEFWMQLPSRERNSQFVFNLERQAAGALPPILTSAGQIAVQTVLMVIALFFLLIDGDRLMRWLNVVSPLHRNQVHELFEEFRRVSVTVLLGSVATAGAQALGALIGYLIARVPNPMFLGIVTFCIGLVPILGAGLFSFLVAVYWFLTGHTVPAIFLGAWSVLVVGLTDNVVKPLVIRSGIEMHGAVVFFALLGGVTVFGLAGVIIGPLSVTLLLAILRIYQRDFAEPSKSDA